MDSICQEEHQNHIERRIELFNRIQSTLGGADAIAAVEAILDSLAVAIVHVCAADRTASHELIDKLVPDLKRCADNNLDLVREQMERMIGLTRSARAAGVLR